MEKEKCQADSKKGRRRKCKLNSRKRIEKRGNLNRFYVEGKREKNCNLDSKKEKRKILTRSYRKRERERETELITGHQVSALPRMLAMASLKASALKSTLLEKDDISEQFDTSEAVDCAETFRRWCWPRREVDSFFPPLLAFLLGVESVDIFRCGTSAPSRSDIWPMKALRESIISFSVAPRGTPCLPYLLSRRSSSASGEICSQLSSVGEVGELSCCLWGK